MGALSKLMKQHFIHTALVIIALAVSCPLAFADQTEKQAMQKTERPVLKNAQEFIELFRKGEDRYDSHNSLPNLMIGNQLDPQAVKVLGEALITDNDDVRDKIVYLLKRLKYLCHPAYELRTPEIIDLLVGPGFAKRDSAKGKAMNLLREYTSPATLSRYGDIFLRELKETPNGYIFLLIAKAKPKGAREVVERLARTPEWKNDKEMRIAQAAFGNTKIEDEFIAVAKQKEEAGDADGLMMSFYPLVEIGTQSSLRAVCQRLRSPLIVDENDAGLSRPIPGEVLMALRYAFPEEADRALRGIATEEGYVQAEQFCELKTGVSYYGIPRPTF